MKLAIMQPYLFPYLGYWQLIDSVDKFVIYDDVNYIKQGYINRNSILEKGVSKFITLETKGASSFVKINEVMVGGNRLKFLKTIQQNYSKAPYFAKRFDLLRELFDFSEESLARFVGNTIQVISYEVLGVATDFVYSSDIKKNDALNGPDKVIEICKINQASHYINAIGGKELYSPEAFKKNGLQLSFIKMLPISYRQFGIEFVPNLSIIDVMMFNDDDVIRSYLREYILVE